MIKRLFIVLAFVFAASLMHAETPVNEPTGLAVYTLKAPGFDWITSMSAHYRLHYLPGSVAQRQIDTLLAQNEAYLTSHLAILGAEKYDRMIDVFYFDSRDQIEEIVTKPFRALADAENMTVLAVRNDDDVARDAHEIMHVVSYDLWGGWERRNEEAWLGEGLATYSDVPCNGYKMSELAAHILKNTDKAVGLDSLALSFRQYPEMIGYPLMASFVEFVLEQYGRDHFRRLWDEGYSGIKNVFGKDVPVLEAEWHAFVLAKYPNADVPDWAEIREKGCR